LLGAWASYGAGDAKAAIESIDKLQGADWYALFKDLHAGLILDLAGNKKEGRQAFRPRPKARMPRRFVSSSNPTAPGCRATAKRTRR